MHDYGTNSSERTVVISVLALIALVCAYSFQAALQALSVIPPWWLDTPAVLGFFGLLYALFDRWLWRISVLHSLGFVRVPNLNGVWEAVIQSSYDSFATTHHVYVTVRQSWTHLCINTKSDRSYSNSVTAFVLVDQPHPTGITLSYEYTNEPKPEATVTMASHRGTAVLNLMEPDHLEGIYYTGRGRQNHGSMILKRTTAHK